MPPNLFNKVYEPVYFLQELRIPRFSEYVNGMINDIIISLETQKLIDSLIVKFRYESSKHNPHNPVELDAKTDEFKQLFQTTMESMHPAFVAKFQEKILAILSESIKTSGVCENIFDEYCILVCFILAYFMVPSPAVVITQEDDFRFLRTPHEPSKSDTIMSNLEWAFICLLEGHCGPEQNCGDYMKFVSIFIKDIESYLSEVTQGYEGFQGL